MGQRSTLVTWSTRGRWRCKKEDSIKEREYPKGRGLEKKKGKTL